MYTAYYELRQEPFHVTPDPEFLFPSSAHKEALAAIIYGIEQRKGFVAITGEVGVGKTTILRSYLDFADRQSLKLIYVYNSNLTFDELVTTILQELGVSDRPPTSFQAITRLHEELIEVYRKNQTVVLIIDEAQNMPVDTLESLRMLSNLETVTEKLIQIMLIGQPELDELLQQHRLRQLRQRIAIHARIDPLNSEDSVAYLEHRLAKVAFGTKPVFTKNALRLIADSAQGIPRNLNILSDNALITGFGSQVRPVNARVVKEVLADRGVAPPPGQGMQRWRGAWVGGAAAAAAIIITMAVLALNPSILKTGAPVQQSEQTPDRTAPPSLAERAPANAPSGVEARAPAAASPPAAPESRPTSGSTNLPTRTVPENVQPAPESPPPVAVAPAPLVQAPPRAAGTVRNEPPQPPARTAQPRPPEAPRAEPPPAQRLAAPPVAAPRAPEIARVEPPAPPRATEPPPAPPRPAAAPPVAVAPPRAAEPPRPAPSGAPEVAANNAAPTPAPAARRAQPVPLQPPPAQRPAAVSPPPAPSVAAVPPPAAPPPAAAVAVPSIMMPSASGSGTVASLPLAPDAIPPRAAAPARTDQSVRMVRVGDSLWTMAEDVYGFVNPNVLRRVQDANPQLRNINVLTPGQEIVFPRVPETSLDRSATQFEGVPSAGRN